MFRVIFARLAPIIILALTILAPAASPADGAAPGKVVRLGRGCARGLGGWWPVLRGPAQSLTNAPAIQQVMNRPVEKLDLTGKLSKLSKGWEYGGDQGIFVLTMPDGATAVVLRRLARKAGDIDLETMLGKTVIIKGEGIREDGAGGDGKIYFRTIDMIAVEVKKK
mgnify:CR=1 FL=1